MQRDFGDAVSTLLSGCSGPADDQVRDVTAIAPSARPPTILRTLCFEAWWEKECHLYAAGMLARQVAEHYALDFEDVLDVVRTVPDNLGNLIDTPQGWAVMAEQIFITLGGSPGGPLLPSIH